ncbi:MAG: AMP-binding protein [Verrucomicrobiota bacterium]
MYKLLMPSMNRLRVFPFNLASMEADEQKFRTLKELQPHLGVACLKGLKTKQFETVIVDAHHGGKALKGGMMLSVAIELSRWLKKNVSEKRVGIVLPPSIGGFLANIACALCDKTPVNLNFSSSKESIQSAMRQAELKTILSADILVQRYPDFPWTENRFDLPSVIQSFSKMRFLFWRLAILLLPSSLLAKWLKIPRGGGDQEAALLFTSGSSGDPKGVPLSHRNILANIAQIHSVLPREDIDSILGCLPIFHSFGFTVTLWWPMICGPKVITYISPLETLRLAEIIQQFKISLLITTPTFLRGFLKRAKPEQLRSLKMIVTGAEKLPVNLLEEFENKFHISVCEGYGMTETTPVISVNLLDFPHAPHRQPPFRKIGTVGRPLPGIAVRVTNPETGAPQPHDQTGLLWFKGANVFNGYLHTEKKNANVLKDGWYCSGDVGYLDAEGFLTIEGRQSRFSKIGGEMVPHGVVEQKLNDLCAQIDHDYDHLHAAIMGVSDPVKGEALVALIAIQVEPQILRKRLAESGLPHLWIPKIFHRVNAIPILPSGKLDLKNCQTLAEKAFRTLK